MLDDFWPAKMGHCRRCDSFGSLYSSRLFSAWCPACVCWRIREEVKDLERASSS